MAFVLVLVLILTPADAEECHGKPSPDASPNTFPLVTAPPRFVRSVPNAKLYTVGSGDYQVPVVHLWGTPYEKGFAHGQLMNASMHAFIESVWVYLEDMVENAINHTHIHIDPKTRDWIADVGLDVALDVTSDLTEPYTGKYFFEEMHGMSDATGISYDKIRRIHMIGELTKGSCSMFGAWGDALPGNSGLLTMRALDWDINGPFRHHPSLIVYHPAPASSENTFVNVGWTGWIGSISGVNAEQMSIHEIGVAFPDASFGEESRSGVPFTYVLRDILQFDKTRLDGVSRLASAHRTCDLILGVGGGKEERFNSVEYSYSTCDIFDDENMRPVAPWHARMKNVVYHGMDWLCPAYNQVLHDRLAKYHGSLTVEDAVRDVMPIVQTGDLHVFVADLVRMRLAVAFAKIGDGSGPLSAYQRPYFDLALKDLFAVTQ